MIGYDARKQVHATVVVGGLGLVLVGDCARLVSDVAGVVAETGDGDLGDEDFFGIVASADRLSHLNDYLAA